MVDCSDPEPSCADRHTARGLMLDHFVVHCRRLYTKRFGTTVTLAERRDADGWRVQPTPNPSGSLGAVLEAVSCTSPSACVAVGQFFTGSGAPKVLAERWDGTSW